MASGGGRGTGWRRRKRVRSSYALPDIDFGVFAIQEWRRIGVEAEHRPLESAAWFADGRDTGNFAPPNNFSNQKLQNVWLSED